MDENTVSVVIPAYNCEKTIDKAIEAINSQSHPVNELIIVDDGSSDATASKIKQYKKVKYLYQKNQGPAMARNYGASVATSNFLFFTDSDCIPKKNWLENALKGFENNSIGVVMGGYDIANKSSILARCIQKEIDYRHSKLIKESPKVFGSYNFGVKREIFSKIGGFDASYRFASGEDNDLSYRILKDGYKINFQRSSLVDHHHPTKILKYLKEQYRHGFWRVKMYLTHPKMGAGDGYTFFKDIVEIPLVVVAITSFMLNLFSTPFMFQVFVLCLLINMALQLFFGFVMTKNIFEGIYYSFVTFLRSFSRTLGFSSGAIHFLLKIK